MEKQINAFISYLHNVKKTSNNTEMSYRRDLNKLNKYFSERNKKDITEVTREDLCAYILYMEEQKFAAATVSRSIASIKAFYHYLNKEGIVKEDISETLKAPKIEKKLP